MGKRRRKLLILAASAIGVIIAGVLPFGLLAIPNPPSYEEVDRIIERGAYVQTGDRFLRLFPYPQRLEAAPADLALVDAQPRLMVKARQFFGEEGYRLEPFPSGALVELTLTMGDEGVMGLSPARPLPAGAYLFTAMQDSVYGGEDYYYFAVEPTSSWVVPPGAPSEGGRDHRS